MSSTTSKKFTSFYDVLCYILNTNKIEQREFAIKYDVDESKLSRWLSGERNPQKKSLRYLSSMLGCQITEVSRGEWEVIKKEGISLDSEPTVGEINDSISEYESRLIDAIKHLPPSDASVELLKSYQRLTQAVLDKAEAEKKRK